MIQSKDLRIGNKLRVNDTIVTVVEIKVYTIKILYGDKYSIVDYEKMTPIELDEGRLTSMGFEPIGTTSNTEYYVQEMAGVDVEIDLDIKRLLIGGVQLQFNGYLHELQNALYLLKGE